MKTSELIAVLKSKLEMHGDLEVCVGYEGIFPDISERGIYKAKPFNDQHDPRASYEDGDDPFLCIDVEGLDKGTQAVDPSEGEPS